MSFEEDVGKDRLFFFSSLFSSEASIFERREMDVIGFRTGLYATTPHMLINVLIHRVGLRQVIILQKESGERMVSMLSSRPFTYL